MKKLLEELKKNITGEIRFDPINKRIYSVDASIYEIEPVGVVIPKTKDEVVQAVKIAKKHKVPIIARGAATGIAGGCIGKGLILDLSKYLNNIIEININQEYAIVQPGLVQDRLNEKLKDFGYRLGPDTSTGNRATIGGMVGNNSAGAYSLKYGKMVDAVLGLEVVMANGETKYFDGNTDDSFTKKIKQIIDDNKEDIRNNFPKIPRRVSGYNLDELVNDFNLAKLITGSEGTLGVVTKVKLKIEKLPKKTTLCILTFDSIMEAMTHVKQILSYKPIAFEMIDDKILGASKENLSFLKGQPKAVFAIEFEEGAQTFIKDWHGQAINLSEKQAKAFWQTRKSGLGLLLSKRSYNRATAFIEDVTVSPNHLEDFMRDFLEILENHKIDAGIYGHVGSGCMHLRPYIDLRKPDELKLMEKVMLDVTDLILKHHGALSGEHGDGLVRSWLNRRLFGKEIYQAFCEIKECFDPENLMNPGKIVHPLPFLQNLRLSPETKMLKIETKLDFSFEGGFNLAADMCNGNALCRKSETIMCPSFQATGDEYHTTRARAQSLRAIIHGNLPLSELTEPALLDVLDLCLECKGCKTECPSSVDMAKMKWEVLYQYQKKHGFSFRNKLFGNIGKIFKITAPFHSLINFLEKTKFSTPFKKFVGITTKRPLPPLAKKRFSKWYSKHYKQDLQKPTVALFVDTFTEYNCPEVGVAAVKVLTSLGYNALLTPLKCCGRTMISKGFLDEAKEMASDLVATLSKFAKEKIPVITLEPSCHFTVIDDYRSLLGYEKEEIKNNLFSFEDFVYQNISTLSNKQKVLFHNHCHAPTQKEKCTNLLQKIAEPIVIPSSCCGLAGSFGYEKEHYEISMKIANLKIVPFIDKFEKNIPIVANGFSCRTQIEFACRRDVLHIAEFVAKVLK